MIGFDLIGCWNLSCFIISYPHFNFWSLVIIFGHCHVLTESQINTQKGSKRTCACSKIWVNVMSDRWDAIEIDMGCFSGKKKRVIYCPHLDGLRQIHWIKKESPDHKLDSCNLCKITKTRDRINDFLIVLVKKCPIFQPIWSEGQLSLLRNSLIK